MEAKISALQNELAAARQMIELKDEEIGELNMTIKSMEDSHENEIFDLCEEIASLQGEKEEIQLEAETVKQLRDDLMLELEEAGQKLKRLKFVLFKLSPPRVSRRAKKGRASKRPDLPTILEEDEDAFGWLPTKLEPPQLEMTEVEQAQFVETVPPASEISVPSQEVSEAGKTQVPAKSKKGKKRVPTKPKYKLLYTFASL